MIDTKIKPIAWQVRYMGDDHQSGYWRSVENVSWAETTYAMPNHTDDHGYQVRPIYDESALEAARQEVRDAIEAVSVEPVAWHLDAETAKFLADMIMADAPDEPTAITLRVGFIEDDEGNVSHGLLVEDFEYPEEGASMLVRCPALVPATQLQVAMAKVAELESKLTSIGNATTLHGIIGQLEEARGESAFQYERAEEVRKERDQLRAAIDAAVAEERERTKQDCIKICEAQYSGVRHRDDYDNGRDAMAAYLADELGLLK